MADQHRVESVIVPVLDALGLALYDLEVGGGVVRVTISREGGIDTEVLTEATRAISRSLDDADPLPGSYTLEVSSPGLERTLRTAEHFAGAVGEHVKLKTRPGMGDEVVRRAEGRLLRTDDTTVVIETTDGEVAVAIDEVERARTVFDWGPAPKPGGKQAGGKQTGSKQAGTASRNKANGKRN